MDRMCAALPSPAAALALIASLARAPVTVSGGS